MAQAGRLSPPLLCPAGLPCWVLTVPLPVWVRVAWAWPAGPWHPGPTRCSPVGPGPVRPHSLALNITSSPWGSSRQQVPRPSQNRLLWEACSTPSPCEALASWTAAPSMHITWSWACLPSGPPSSVGPGGPDVAPAVGQLSWNQLTPANRPSACRSHTPRYRGDASDFLTLREDPLGSDQHPFPLQGPSAQHLLFGAHARGLRHVRQEKPCGETADLLLCGQWTRMDSTGREGTGLGPHRPGLESWLWHLPALGTWENHLHF